MLCYMTIQVYGIQILHRCAAKKVKHFALLAVYHRVEWPYYEFMKINFSPYI